MLVEAYGHNDPPESTADSGLEYLRTTIRLGRQGTRRSTKKIRRWGFGSDTRWRSMPKWNAISRSIKCYPAMHFKTIASNWNGSKEGKLSERATKCRKTMCEILLKRYKRKSFLHRIIIGDEKWIHYDNAKCQKAWVRPSEAAPSEPKANIHGSKLMLSIWWDQ